MTQDMEDSDLGPIVCVDEKPSTARKLALALTDTDVTSKIINSWTIYEIYEWLEAWGFRWNGDAWTEDKNVPT